MRLNILNSDILRLILLDLSRAIRNIFPADLSIWIGYPCILFISSLVFDISVQPHDRCTIIFLMSAIFSCYIPGGGFSHINGHNNTIIHIMLPINRNIKFFSLILTGSVIIPGLFILMLYLTDILTQHILKDLLPIHNVATLIHTLKEFAGIIMLQSVFVLGNILFRKHKIGYSFICLSLLCGIAFLILDLLADTDIEHYAIGLFILRYILPIFIYISAYDRFRHIEL